MLGIIIIILVTKRKKQIKHEHNISKKSRKTSIELMLQLRSHVEDQTIEEALKLRLIQKIGSQVLWGTWQNNS